jgi:hypothetical protein
LPVWANIVRLTCFIAGRRCGAFFCFSGALFHKIVRHTAEYLDGTLEAIDIDGNGIVGNASVDYQSLINGEDEIKNGYALEGIRININRVRPPKVISITNSNGYVYVVPDTSIYRVSDGFFWDKTESYGGFYGDTTFIFGEGEEDFFVGTRYRKPNSTFIFK